MWLKRGGGGDSTKDRQAIFDLSPSAVTNGEALHNRETCRWVGGGDISPDQRIFHQFYGRVDAFAS